MSVRYESLISKSSPGTPC